jgi:predicted transcriptional regulator
MRVVRKDTRLTFRVCSELKQQLEVIAEGEDQSVARICEAFLAAGIDSYKRKGKAVLERYIGKLSAKRGST